MKSICVRSFSRPYFPAFGQNTERYGEISENADQKNSEYGHFSQSEHQTLSGKLEDNCKWAYILSIIQYALKINFIEKLNQSFPKLAHGILETDKIPHEVFLNSIIKSFEILS